MVLQLQVWAMMLLQEAAAPSLGRFRPTFDVGSDGLAGAIRRHHAVHYVGVVHRRDDRPRDRL